MRSQVLSLIDNAIRLAQTSSADKCQCLYNQLPTLLHLIQAFQLRRRRRELMLDNIQIIKERLHVRCNLLLSIARQETDIFVRQSHNRTCQQNLFIIIHLPQSCCQSQQRLSRTSLASQRHQFNIRVVQNLESKTLLSITWLDTIVLRFSDSANSVSKRIITCQHTIPLAFQDKTFVRMNHLATLQLTDINTIV